MGNFSIVNFPNAPLQQNRAPMHTSNYGVVSYQAVYLPGSITLSKATFADVTFAGLNVTGSKSVRYSYDHGVYSLTGSTLTKLVGISLTTLSSQTITSAMSFYFSGNYNTTTALAPGNYWLMWRFSASINWGSLTTRTGNCLGTQTGGIGNQSAGAPAALPTLGRMTATSSDMPASIHTSVLLEVGSPTFPSSFTVPYTIISS